MELIVGNTDKIKKEQEKRRKEQEKRIHKTLKKAKVSKNDSQEEIDKKLIEYASNVKTSSKFFEMGFTNEQLNNPEFLLKLYKAYPDCLDYYRPSPSNKKLINNIDFMVNYFKLLLNQKSWINLRMAIKDFNRLTLNEYNGMLFIENNPFIGNNEFLLRIPTDFPNEIISQFIMEYYIQEKDYTNNSEKYYLKCKNILESLPLSILCEQARKFGAKAIKYVPKDLKGFSEIVSAGIENDGFSSLEELDISQVLENKDLIMKACELKGEKALVKYIHSLSPYRTVDCVKLGKLDSYKIYDENYAKVQEALANDKDIKSILMKFAIKISKQVRTEYVIEDENSSSESSK